jgi:hypothetical protein
VLVLVQRSQTASADLKTLGIAVPKDCDFLDIWFPLALGLDVRMADVVPKRRSFAADITLCHECTSLAQIEPAQTSAGSVQTGFTKYLTTCAALVQAGPGRVQ